MADSTRYTFSLRNGDRMTSKFCNCTNLTRMIWNEFLAVFTRAPAVCCFALRFNYTKITHLLRWNVLCHIHVGLKVRIFQICFKDSPNLKVFIRIDILNYQTSDFLFSAAVWISNFTGEQYNLRVTMSFLINLKGSFRCTMYIES